MYLGMLSSEEKDLFLQLAISIASVDGDYNDVEKTMINSYCIEMGVNNSVEKEKSISSIIERFSIISTEQTKKIVLFEAIGLALSDRNYDKKEEKTIIDIAKTFNIDIQFVEESKKIVKEYFDFQQRINDLVL